MTTNFPRTDTKGYVDDGRRIGPESERCWNCGSTRYYQTVSIEHCPSCGIRCDYWGQGSNDIYERAMQRANEVKEREEDLRQWREKQNWREEDVWP